MVIEAPAKIDRKTKRLAKRLIPGDIAVINHTDIDEVSANSLVEAKVKLVINASESISGKYPNKGPEILTKNNILIIDNIGEQLFEEIVEGDIIKINHNEIYRNGNYIGSGELLDKSNVEGKLAKASENLPFELDRFIDNTIEYVKKEKDFILGNLNIPKVSTNYRGRHVLVVVRGQDYKKDLEAIISYIKKMNPILVGVDGGADALIEYGYTPDVIVGDMDSVTDKALKKAKEIIVHAYQDGKAPGLKRVENLGLKAKTFPAPGTSEDIAMLMAYEYGAELIVALGTHSNIVDFLEKGRKGMSSTFLVRLKIGSKLIDAKGVNLLYDNTKLEQSEIKVKKLVFRDNLNILISKCTSSLKNIFSKNKNLKINWHDSIDVSKQNLLREKHNG